MKKKLASKAAKWQDAIMQDSHPSAPAMLPRYASLVALRRHLGPEHPLRGDWRMLESRIGQFHALPGMRGVQLATDGCHLIAESEQGDRVFVGHVTNWVLDSNHSPSKWWPGKITEKKEDLISSLLKDLL